MPWLKPIDCLCEISASESRLIESPTPGIVLRHFLFMNFFKQDLSFASIGLIILGDKQTGKRESYMNLGLVHHHLVLLEVGAKFPK